MPRYKPTITVSATPDYSAGDAVGTGYLTFTGACSGPGRLTRLMTCTVRDAAGQGPALKVLFFDTPPAGTYTDNSAADLSAADLAAVVGQLSIAAADYLTTDSYSVAMHSDLNLMMGSTSSHLYAVVVANGAYNAAADTDLSIVFDFSEVV